MTARITNNMGRFIKRIEDKAQVGMTQALIKGGAEAAGLTPIGDTTNLLLSQYKSVNVEDGRVVGRVGYTVNYALPVHDPDHPQKFRRASAEKDFLKKGFERAESLVRNEIRKALK